jgi:hypothetical protein
MSRFTKTARPTFQTEDFSVVLVHAERKRGRVTALQKIEGEYLINRQIQSLLRVFGSVDIIVVTGYEGPDVEKVLSRRTRVVINERFDETDFGHSTMLGIKATATKACYVIEGSLDFNHEVFVPKVESHIFLGESEIGLIQQDGIVTNLSYGVTPTLGKIIYFAEREVKQYLLNYKDTLLFHEVLNLCIDNGSRIKVVI